MRTGLLRARPAFRALCASRAVSSIGDGVGATVLTLLVARSDGPAGVSALLLAGALPRFGGPLAGALADRYDTRRLMATCELTAALVVGLIAVTLPPLPVLVGLAAVVATLATVRAPAGRSLVPVLVGPLDRAPANALFGAAFDLRLAVGPALGGLLMAAPGGAHTALAGDAASFLVSAVLLRRLPRSRSPRDRAVSGIRAEAVAGVVYVVRHRPIRTLVLVVFLLVAFAAVDNVALVFLVEVDLAGGPGEYGLAAGAFGAGMLLASAGCVRWARGGSGLLAVAIVATAAGTAATGLAPALAVAAVAQLVAGTGNAIEHVAEDTLVQGLVPRALLGRVFGTVATAAQLGAGVAYLGGGLLVGPLGARGTLVVAGAGTLAALVLLRSIRDETLGAQRI